MISKSFSSIAIRLTGRLTPLMSIWTCWRQKADVMMFLEGRVVLMVHGVLSFWLLISNANLVEIKECVAPESNNV